MRFKKTYWSLITQVLLSILVSCSDQPFNTYKIEKGTFNQTIVETGELAAIDTRSFMMPSFGRYWYQMKIIGMLDHGTVVKAGDSIIQLDATDVKKVIIDLEGELETQQAALDKLVVYQKNKLSEMKANLKNGQASFNLKKLEMEFSRFESDQIRKIKKLEFEQEEIMLSKINRSFELNKIIARNELKIQKTRVNQLERDLKNAYAVLPKLTIRTPIPGIFQVATNRRTGNMVKIGEQIYQGNYMGNVPDLTNMKVNTSVSEDDFFKINMGQKVVIRLDAIPDVSFQGKVSNIGKLCHLKDSKSRLKVFDVEVKLLTPDERLKPGMTVSCEFYCKELKNTIFVPLNCIDTIESGSCIYLQKGKGKGFILTKVKTGQVNNTHIVIFGNFNKGQQLLSVDDVKRMNNN
jgi:HlyD family secretion protein